MKIIRQINGDFLKRLVDNEFPVWSNKESASDFSKNTPKLARALAHKYPYLKLVVIDTESWDVEIF